MLSLVFCCFYHVVFYCALCLVKPVTVLPITVEVTVLPITVEVTVLPITVEATVTEVNASPPALAAYVFILKLYYNLLCYFYSSSPTNPPDWPVPV
ncbi:unnamed protein product [Macrosiphum euphorbiae]|uniref:Secreted protein n=1 Tax=Macrosiphum euphorbiae TaxID=13131 RepID=A0AAV0WIH3_9HEMI|nr:unnamed protein product [Macrosiphum euphorbiae]CAI6357008.1 unnamed protein product [Macrosiphum euphorbiae]CAI6364130.1 unnamed protein product [Macrosiphum euphorbiae]